MPSEVKDLGLTVDVSSIEKVNLFTTFIDLKGKRGEPGKVYGVYRTLMTEEQKQAREETRKKEREIKKANNKAEREVERKAKAVKKQKHKDEKKSLLNKKNSLNAEIRSLVKHREFEKANLKQDLINDIEKQLNELKSLKLSEIYERY